MKSVNKASKDYKVSQASKVSQVSQARRPFCRAASISHSVLTDAQKERRNRSEYGSAHQIWVRLVVRLPVTRTPVYKWWPASSRKTRGLTYGNCIVNFSKSLNVSC